ncbi:transmembrane protein 231-like [Watersipora subatra]|uniref:transmembrane protein 231-like n=1 Tax=Watersipora subatra TaxID=2589382 RepID=UPI00355AD5BF
MAMYDVYSHPEFRRYRASICSKASIFMLFMYLFTFIIPILIIYRTNGLWITTWTVEEQPEIKFKHQVITFADIRDSRYVNPSFLAWSTYPQFNIIHQANLRIPAIKSREDDANRDGKNDVLYFDMEIPVNNTENIHKFQLLLFFECRLKELALVTFEAMAVVSGESYLSGAAYTTIGELWLKQRHPLVHKGTDNTWSTSVVDSSSLTPSDYDLSYLFKGYSSRNLTASFVSEYSIWTSGRPSGNRFMISVEMRYPEQNVLYYTGFWQMFKYALVQYIAILLVFAFLCERLKLFVFSHQLINTVMIKPYKNC